MKPNTKVIELEQRIVALEAQRIKEVGILQAELKSTGKHWKEKHATLEAAAKKFFGDGMKIKTAALSEKSLNDLHEYIESRYALFKLLYEGMGIQAWTVTVHCKDGNVETKTAGGLPWESLP